MTQNMRSVSGNFDIVLQVAILTQNIVLRREDDPKYEVWEWKLRYRITSSDFDPNIILRREDEPKFEVWEWQLRYCITSSDFDPKYSTARPR